MSNFKFDLEDLTNDNDDALLREIHKDNAKPLTTTRSNQGGDPGRLSVLSMGQIMMGVPLYNTGSDVSKIQELTFTHLLTGAIVDPKGEGTGTLNIKGFNTEQLIPADVLADAKAIGAKLAAERPKNTGGGDGANYGHLPADVVASEAFKHTSLTGPHIEKFIYLLLQQQGDTYSQSSRGITDDPNPSSFDCSGLVWWGTNQLIKGAEGMPNVSNAQFAYFADRGTEITLDQGIRSPGALLFYFTAVGNQEGHVSTSLGNGTHMGAQNPSSGVRIDGVDGYKFNKACLMSMFNYHGTPPPGPVGVNAGTGTLATVLSASPGGSGAGVLLTIPQVLALARQAGFSGENLVHIVAIAIRESGLRTDATGDVSIETAEWGPSVGLVQIRSLNAQKGTGGERDELANYNPLVNLQHAWSISGGGTNFGPWSTNLGWEQYRPPVDAAIAAGG